VSNEQQQTNDRTALEAAQQFAGSTREQQQPAAWQVKIRRGGGDFLSVFRGTKEEASARYERERDKLAGGVVRLYHPNGLFVRQATR
jgi:hypothetical protein